jgi:hypothetical protein
MFYFAVFFGDVCQLLDQCVISQLLLIQNSSIKEVPVLSTATVFSATSCRDFRLSQFEPAAVTFHHHDAILDWGNRLDSEF